MKNSRQIALIALLAALMAAIPIPGMPQAGGRTISAARFATAALQRGPSNSGGGRHAEGSRPDRAATGRRAEPEIPPSTIESSVELARKAWTGFDYRRAL